ncbi:MAG: Holliday junction branch migration DNA helicase RuvB, partial [Planctomycetota bacterium]|nr:Holliday junction branch migration DNA helicase RuvB [Planctomycetota bacterium]
VLERPADLAGILTNLKRGDVLFIDEAHRMPKIVEEYLYSAMEDFVINIVLDSGPAARTIKLPLSHFTLVAATTREGLLTGAFRARFGVSLKLNFYSPEELKEVILRSAKILDVPIEPDAAEIVSQRARGTPRLANRLLRRLRDVAQVKGNGTITSDIAEKGLLMLGIDKEGCEQTDRAILRTLIDHGGGPVGVKTIAVSVGEETDTIEDVYEPYLIRKGFLRKTQRGRMLSEKAYSYMNETPPAHIQGSLFESGGKSE